MGFRSFRSVLPLGAVILSGGSGQRGKDKERCPLVKEIKCRATIWLLYNYSTHSVAFQYLKINLLIFVISYKKSSAIGSQQKGDFYASLPKIERVKN